MLNSIPVSDVELLLPGKRLEVGACSPSQATGMSGGLPVPCFPVFPYLYVL